MTYENSPLTVDEMSADWLSASLKRSGFQDAEVSGFEYTVLGEGAGFAGLVVRVVPDYAHHDADGPASLICKFSTTNKLNLDMLAAYDVYRSEVLFYRSIASVVGARRPLCYSADVSEDGRASAILLEDFPDHQVGDQVTGCSLEQAHLLMVEAAKLHAPFWDRTAPAGGRSYVGAHGDNIANMSFAVWPTVGEKFPESVPTRVVTLRDEYAALVPQLHRWIATAPSTVVHGDMRLDNILFGREGKPDPVVLLDWQACM